MKMARRGAGPGVGYIKRCADVPPGWQRDEEAAGMPLRYMGAALDVPYVTQSRIEAKLQRTTR